MEDRQIAMSMSIHTLGGSTRTSHSLTQMAATAVATHITHRCRNAAPKQNMLVASAFCECFPEPWVVGSGSRRAGSGASTPDPGAGELAMGAPPATNNKTLAPGKAEGAEVAGTSLAGSDPRWVGWVGHMWARLPVEDGRRNRRKHPLPPRHELGHGTLMKAWSRQGHGSRAERHPAPCDRHGHNTDVGHDCQTHLVQRSVKLRRGLGIAARHA